MRPNHSLTIGIDGRGIYKTIDGIGRYSLNLIRSSHINRQYDYAIKVIIQSCMIQISMINPSLKFIGNLLKSMGYW
jgi:hypothetical protein